MTFQRQLQQSLLEYSVFREHLAQRHTRPQIGQCLILALQLLVGSLEYLCLNRLWDDYDTVGVTEHKVAGANAYAGTFNGDVA